MALSFESVRKAYEVLNIIKREHFPELRLPAWPGDFSEEYEQEDPPELLLVGDDKKYDDGWGALVFFVKSKPSDQFIKRFTELAKRVPNSSMCKEYSKNKAYWIVGWF